MCDFDVQVKSKVIGESVSESIKKQSPKALYLANDLKESPGFGKSVKVLKIGAFKFA